MHLLYKSNIINYKDGVTKLIISKAEIALIGAGANDHQRQDPLC